MSPVSCRRPNCDDLREAFVHRRERIFSPFSVKTGSVFHVDFHRRSIYVQYRGARSLPRDSQTDGRADTQALALRCYKCAQPGWQGQGSLLPTGALDGYSTGICLSVGCSETFSVNLS